MRRTTEDTMKRKTAFKPCPSKAMKSHTVYHSKDGENLKFLRSTTLALNTDPLTTSDSQPSRTGWRAPTDMLTPWRAQ